jgi:hypothetical protein
MSSPHVIVSAVHELDENPKEFWTDDNVQDVIQGFDKEVWDEDWHMCTAEFKSSKALDIFDVVTEYHSKRKTDVAEIVIDGQNDIQSVSTTGIEKIIEEINFQFDRDFTLEVYYWYDGADKPGGT